MNKVTEIFSSVCGSFYNMLSFAVYSVFLILHFYNSKVKNLMNFSEDLRSNPASFWDHRYSLNETGWDIGYASPPLTFFVDKLENKQCSILIPGCGNAYEAEYLINKGFTNISVIDISETLIQSLKQKWKGIEGINLLLGDFFELEGQFDLILEQTFFCAIDPKLRAEYVSKMATILSPNGVLAGVYFNCEFDKQGPPFGGNIEEYKTLFSTKLNIRKLEPCYNSIPQREGRESFGIFSKKLF